MWYRLRKFLWRRLAIAAACLAATGCLWLLVAPTAQSWYVERCITRFERNPSQGSANALVELLQGHAATTEQGQRILKLLRLPKIRTRPAYPAGLPVTIAVERPFHLDFRSVLWREEEIRINGQQRQKHWGPGGEQPDVLHLRCLSAWEAKPGTHAVTIGGTYGIGLERRGLRSGAGRCVRGVLSYVGLSVPTIWQPSRTYECAFEMPVEISVVPKEQVTPIALSSSEALDRAMRKAFWVRLSCFTNRHSTASGQVKYDPVKAVYYHDLPMDVAFALTLQLSGNHEPARTIEFPTRLRARAGSSGKLDLHPRLMSIQKPGTYRGSITLTPDPNAAYEDPAIEAIWNGTLELPISFRISTELNWP